MLTELEHETIHIAADLFRHLPDNEMNQLKLDLAQLFEDRKRAENLHVVRIAEYRSLIL